MTDWPGSYSVSASHAETPEHWLVPLVGLLPELVLVLDLRVEVLDLRVVEDDLRVVLVD